jgi:hypothetical protein
MIDKLSRACYPITSMPHTTSTDTLKSIYFAYFHSVMKYGVIFWVNFPSSEIIFTLQKRNVRIIADVKSRNSCRNLVTSLEILPLSCEYIFTSMNFVVNNQEHFQTNSAIHSVNTRNRDHLYRPTANFSCFQKMHTMLASKSSAIFHQIWEVLWIKRHNLSSIKKLLKYSLLLLCWGIPNA